MKKILSIIILILVLFSFGWNCEAKTAKKKKKTKQRIEFVSKDKFILVGDFYIPDVKSNKPLVVLVHSYAMSAMYWATLAEDLRQKGYSVLAMDLRGHNRSVYNEKLQYKSRYNFKNSDWQKLPLDIVNSIQYIKNTYPKVNTNETILVGADIGANACVLAGLLGKIPPKKMVLISPMYEFKGLKMPVNTKRLQDVLMMIVLSSSDKMMFDFSTKTKPIVKQYAKGGPGMGLLKVNTGAYSDVINFIVN